MPADYEGKPLEKVLKAARLCGYAGQTVVIYQRSDGEVYCNFKENQSCEQNTDNCRLRDAEAEEAGA